MLNSTSFTGIYLVNGPSAKKVDETVSRIKQECKKQQVDCDTFLDPITNAQLVFTEGDAALSRQNKDEYISHSNKIKDIVENTPDDINKQMAQMPKRSESLKSFLKKLRDETLYEQELDDRAGAISKDLDEGTFNVVKGTGPNLSKAIEEVCQRVLDDIMSNLKK